MYILRTTKQNIFNTPVGQPLKKKSKKRKFKNLKHQIPASIETPSVIKEVNLHYPIKISTIQSLKILFSCIMRDNEETKILKSLKKKGFERIE